MGAHFAPEPDPRELPVAEDSVARYRQHCGGFLYAQPAKEAQFDDAAFPLVEFRERLERVVERDDVITGFAGYREGLVEAHLDGSAAALLRAACPRVVHENAAHHPRRHRKEMSAILPRDSVCIDQPDIGFVHERRRLEAVAGTFPRHAAARDSIKLLVYERNQSLEGGFVALRPSEEERRHFGWIVRDGAILSVLASFPTHFPLS